LKDSVLLELYAIEIRVSFEQPSWSLGSYADYLLRLTMLCYMILQELPVTLNFLN